MNFPQIISAIDEEIGRLERVKFLLTSNGETPAKSRGGVTFDFGMNQGTAPKKRRRMNAETRAKIAAAQKKRWAGKKEAAK